MVLPGKHIVITGATSGIGLETAKALAGMGASITLIARNDEKVKSIIQSIQEDTENTDIDFVKADLASQKQIRQAATEILQRHPVINVLINNAATWQSHFALTEDHIERMFAVNHLSYFLLTHCLMEGLKKASEARIINVASGSHFNGKIHWDNLNLEGNYHGLRAYGQSKLANVLFTYEFAGKNPGLNITINAVHPGLVKTDIGTKHTTLFHTLAWRLRRMSGVTPKEGAATSIYLASSPKISDITGEYWSKCQIAPSSEASHNREDAERLWNVCEKLCGITDYFLQGL